MRSKPLHRDRLLRWSRSWIRVRVRVWDGWKGGRGEPGEETEEEVDGGGGGDDEDEDGGDDEETGVVGSGGSVRVWISKNLSLSLLNIIVGRIGTETPTNEAGEVTSHLQGMFNRTIRLLEAGIKPVYVFDGQPPDLKKQELAKRYSKTEDASKELTAAIEVALLYCS
ncbi:flap endonuclease 1-A-like [Dioscorea cayenensis subsp. rotundata]|uniref:Flap endonuclease 1-A-like n=1 Tax=Dioscorea cayennensis subsp. rotundata TaxID=55577 RepID=A0AB40CEI2_DIOCR|nr:flap endonuclease 1-A-like [Dioscorea cayenensis subsp. rotundata]